jgi:hypothetical protein
MPERLPSIFLVAGAAILLLLLWVISIIYVYFHSGQCGLDDQNRMTWVALATLLPLIGFVAYLIFGGLSKPGQSRSPDRSRPAGSRVTLYQAQGYSPDSTSGQSQVRMDTIAGVDLLKSTRPGSPPPPFKSPYYKSRPFRSTPQQSPQRLPSTMPPPPVSVYQLSVISGPYQGQKFLLEDLPARIGRGSWATIHLDQDLSISRQHAEITRQDGAYILRDLNSSHGTRLNGQPVTESPLAAGDRLEMGSSEFLVQAIDRRAG